MGGTAEILERFRRNGMTVCRRDFLADGLPSDWPVFDLITFFAVIEHLPQSPRGVLAAMREYLRPSGHLVVTTPNHAWIRTRLRLLLGRTVHYPLATWWETPFFGHVREYTRDELAQMLRWAGFERVRTTASNWAHVTSRLPRARPDEPERWTTRLTLRTPREWLVAASLLATQPFAGLHYSLLAIAQKPGAG
jgi:2-polyprenyl-3-methyl-5-hydroxy-6-metoxy-1,4-benzoquinol methylase